MSESQAYDPNEVERAFAAWVAETKHVGPILNSSASTMDAVGKSLIEIRGKRLYRTQFDNFYVYCARRFGLLPDRVDYYISLTEPGQSLMTPKILPPRVEIKESCVYFVLGGDFVKIGYTSDLQRRLAALQTASPVKLVLLATLPGDKRTEGALHKQFAEDRQHGEWFLFSAAIKAFLDGHS